MVSGRSNWDAFCEGFWESQRIGLDKKENWTPLLYYLKVSGILIGLVVSGILIGLVIVPIGIVIGVAMEFIVSLIW